MCFRRACRMRRARVALALGLGMIFLSRGLARRKRRAWGLAVALVIASAIAHLAKGLDFEEATVHVVLLVALVRARRQFVAPGRPCDGAAARAGHRRARRCVGGARRSGCTTTTPIRTASRSRSHCSSARSASGRCGCGYARTRCRRPAAGTASARPTLVHEHGTDSLSYFSLRRDKSYFFSPSGRSFLAYRVLGGTALVAGDPDRRSGRESAS